MDYTTQLYQLLEQEARSNKKYIQIWTSHILFTWQWWVQLALVIVPIVVWILLRKRNCTNRLLYVGFFVFIITSWLDFTGNSFMLWYYPYKLVPTHPPIFPWESFIIVEVLLLLQYKSTFSPWLKAIAFATVNSFIGEPLAHGLGLYIPLHWRYIYSFPIYIVIYLITHYMARVEMFARLEGE